MRIILLINVLLLFLIRFLIKNNKFIVWLGYLTILFQILVMVTTPFRTRGTSLTLSFEYLLSFFLLISLSLVLIPILFSLILNEKKKNDLVALEIKTVTFLYNLIHQIRGTLFYIKYFKDLEVFLANKVTKFCWFFLSRKIGRIFFVFSFYVLPWMVFISHFYLDLFINKSFYVSVYMLAGWFFFMRLGSLILFCSKNTVWDVFTEKILEDNKELYFYTISQIEWFFLNQDFLEKIIFDPEVKQNLNLRQDVNFWKQFNIFVYYFIIFAFFETFWERALPKFKRFLISINFITVFLAVLFYINFVMGLWFLFVSSFLIIEFYNICFQETNTEDVLQFLKSYPYFIYKLQYRLIVERNYSKSDYATGLNKNLPQITIDSWWEINYYTSLKFSIITIVMLIFGICSVNSPEAFQFWIEHIALV